MFPEKLQIAVACWKRFDLSSPTLKKDDISSEYFLREFKLLFRENCLK